MSIYKGMLEASTISVDSNGEPIEPYFDVTEVNEYVTGYLNKNISRYSSDYSTDVSTSNENRTITISLRAKINHLYKYENSQVFSIKTGEEL